MRLDKYLSSCFIGTRKEVTALIKDKQITVNNVIITDESYNVIEYKDIVKYNDVELNYKEHYYYLLNKPAGYITSTSDPLNKTVMELLTDLPVQLQKELFPIGRLDKDTEGLLIITNDGKFSHQLTSPTYQVHKTYYVEYEGVLVDNATELVKAGLSTEKEVFLPGILEPINDHSCYLTIKEGKYHQVKKMTHELGVVLTYLKRVKISNIELPKDLEVGKYTEIDEFLIKNKAFNEYR